MQTKKVIITGANEGIGYYFVRYLLLKQYFVTVLDLQINNLKELEEFYPANLLAIECDVKNENTVNEAVKKSAAKFNGIDIAIHNACKCTFNNMETSCEDTYKDIFDVNYYGALRLTKAVIPYMKAIRRGKIIYTSSGVGIMGFVNISPYASSKAAIESLAKCLNIEYQQQDITFHIFHPPLTRTKSSSPLPVPDEFMADPKKVGKGLAKNINNKGFIICHSFLQKFQTLLIYLFPIMMGKFMSKMTVNYTKNINKVNNA